jgi:hypothetical protein
MSGSIALRWSGALVALAAVVALVIGASAGEVVAHHADGTTNSAAPDGHGWLD